MSEVTSTTWKSQSGYIWSMIGSAVGFANILSFSAQIYKNGGGAFLLPYALALFFLGVPMLILEGMIGNRWKVPLVSAYGIVAGKRGQFFGWLAVIACLSIGGFYIVLTSYSVAYTYFAAANMIPEDTKYFFFNTVLQSTPDVTQFGSLSWPIFLATLLVALSTWFVLVRNVKDGIERICSTFMPLLAILMTFFLIASCLLPGGLRGWVYYLTPHIERLADPMLWRDVFGQLFFSLSLGLGIIVGYSRHTCQKVDVKRAMIYVALGDFAVSFISGGAIFCCLAHISHTQGVPFESILNTESTFEIGFILFPTILKSFGPGLSEAIGALFFFCVFIAGVTGVFSIVESIAGNIEVEFKTTRPKSVTATLVAMAALATLFCMGNSMHLIDALAPMVIGTNMLIGGLALIAVFARPLGLQSFSLRWLAPTVLALILAGNLWQEFSTPSLASTIRWTWLLIAIGSSIALTRFVKRPKVARASSSH